MFLAEFMPDHLAAKAAELEQELPVIPAVSILSDRRPLRQAA